MEVGHAVEEAAPEDRRPRVGVEAEEPHAGLPVGLHVGAQVQFREAGEEGQVGKRPAHHPRHAERDQGHPGRSVKLLEPQSLGEETAQPRGVDPVVDERQVEPMTGATARRAPAAARVDAPFFLEQSVHVREPAPR